MVEHGSLDFSVYRYERASFSAVFFPGFCLQVYGFVFVLEASRRPQTYAVKQWVFFFLLLFGKVSGISRWLLILFVEQVFFYLSFTF
jgi:hypothetical protein